MTTRILPPDEWPRLAGTEAERLWPLLDASTSKVVVVEHEDRIVGCHVLMQMLHAECLWIDSAHRGHSSVQRRLWSAVQEEARSSGVHAVITHAVDDRVRELLSHVGATKIEGDVYAVPVVSARDREDAAIGERFHASLEAQLSVENHPDDSAHNREVGKALRIAIDEHDVDAAVAGYNAWAAKAGYEQVRVVDSSGSLWVLDMGSATIAIRKDYSVTVISEKVMTCQ